MYLHWVCEGSPGISGCREFPLGMDMIIYCIVRRSGFGLCLRWFSCMRRTCCSPWAMLCGCIADIIIDNLSTFSYVNVNMSVCLLYCVQVYLVVVFILQISASVSQAATDTTRRVFFTLPHYR